MSLYKAYIEYTASTGLSYGVKTTCTFFGFFTPNDLKFGHGVTEHSL